MAYRNETSHSVGEAGERKNEGSDGGVGPEEMALTSPPKASGPVHKWQPARVSERPGLSSCPSGTTEGGNGKQVAPTAVLSHGAGAGRGQAALAVGRKSW